MFPLVSDLVVRLFNACSKSFLLLSTFLECFVRIWEGGRVGGRERRERGRVGGRGEREGGWEGEEKGRERGWEGGRERREVGREVGSLRGQSGREKKGE